MYRWFRTYGWGKRMATNKRTFNHQECVDAMDAHLMRLRCILQVKPPHQPVEVSMDPKWGYFKPCHRFSLDQVGIELDTSLKRGTWASAEERKRGFIRIRTAGPSADKRIATLQVCLSGDLSGEQCRLAVFLRGKGHVTSFEKAQYPPDIDVYWQSKAWLDTTIHMSWVNRTWKEFKDKAFPSADLLLTVDNAKPQVHVDSRNRLRELRTECLRGRPNLTHVWQLVDRGPARQIKFLFAQALEEKLQSKKAFEKWTNRMTAADKRVQFLWLVKAAWDSYKSNCVDMHKSFAEKCGHNMTINGEEHDLVKLESGGYTVPEYDPFPGLAEELEAVWLGHADAVYISDEEPEKDASTSSSASDSSSSDDTSVDEQVKDVLETEPKDPSSSSSESSSSSSSSSNKKKAASASSSSSCPILDENDVKQLLRRANFRKQLVSAAKHLVKNVNKTLKTPTKYKGKKITMAVLLKVFPSYEELQGMIDVD